MRQIWLLATLVIYAWHNLPRSDSDAAFSR